MRIFFISDTMGATHPNNPGHGLGKANWMLANGLQEAGHEVTLFGAPGSAFSGRTIVSNGIGVKYETEIAKAVYQFRDEADVYIEANHKHILSGIFTELPVINLYHDKWQPHRRNAVLVSEGMRALLPKEFATAQVVHNQLDAKVFIPSYRPDDDPAYAAYIGFIYKWKQPILAVEAAARARLKLYLAGAMQEGNDMLDTPACNSRWIGAQHPDQIKELLRGAQVYLQLGDNEAFGLTTIEAGLSGTPVVAWPTGGNLDTVKEGVNGSFVDIMKTDVVDAVCEAIERAKVLPRNCVREFAEEHFGRPCLQVKQMEALMEAVLERECW